MTVSFTRSLVLEYNDMFANCKIDGNKLPAVDKIVDKITANKGKYEAVASKFAAMPMYFVGAIHNMESSLNFNAHLHNGNPLSARTVDVPSGRPVCGFPPFTWEESAEDALRLKKLALWSDWTIAGTLFQLERYNGFGYRNYHSQVKTPYLWSFSNWYTKGKYVSDGSFDKDAISKQCGAAVIIRRMVDRGLIVLP